MWVGVVLMMGVGEVTVKPDRSASARQGTRPCVMHRFCSARARGAAERRAAHSVPACQSSNGATRLAHAPFPAALVDSATKALVCWDCQRPRAVMSACQVRLVTRATRTLVLRLPCPPCRT